MSAQERFIEEMGLISQQHDGSRIAGRIIGLLTLEGRELSLQQISERLGVSRASVSTNARLLARRGTLRLTTRAGDRQDYYQMSGGSHFEMLHDLAQQFDRHAKAIGACSIELEAEDPQAAERVNDLKDFFEKSAGILHDWAGALREEKTTGKERA